MLRSLLIICSISFICEFINIPEGTGNAGVKKGIIIIKNLAYADSSRNNKLDLYIPDYIQGIVPVILWIHGGGFRKGNKVDYSNSEDIENLARKGYVVASIDYHFIDEEIWPAQIYDTKSAIRWIRANASKYRINQDRIGIIGLSAGANLSMLAGTSGDIINVEGTTGGNNGYSSKVQATVNISGASDYSAIFNDCVNQSNYDCERLINKNFELFGCDSVDRCFELELEASAVSYISHDDPPAMILNGENELIPLAQAVVFYNKLMVKQVEAKLVIAPGNMHSKIIYYQYFDEIVDFFDACLK